MKDTVQHTETQTSNSRRHARTPRRGKKQLLGEKRGVKDVWVCGGAALSVTGVCPGLQPEALKVDDSDIVNQCLECTLPPHTHE